MAKGDEQTAAAIVAAARGPKKITTPELIHGLCSEFMELHGDRGNGDDQAVIGGIGIFNQQPVTLIATDKGTSAEERIAKNFGSPLPAGYRKARRLIMQAAKFHRPVITFVNTSGAYPGQAAEENGQGEAIARNLLELSTVPVPMITIILVKGEAEERLLWPAVMRCGCLKIQCTRFYHQKGLRQSCGRIVCVQQKPLNFSN